jgi:predicted N-formylglutamate amidohydrolase
MMTQSWKMIAGNPQSPFFLIADHASNHVPEDVELGVPEAWLNTHIAVDLGVAALGREICLRLGCPGILGAVSRLVIDLNREEDATGLIPLDSDGKVIAGNALDPEQWTHRINRYWRPYHDRIAKQIAAQAPRLLISLHSFTPSLESRPEEARPWEVGILYNEDDRAARIAIPMLEASGVVVGDQLPYSGKHLNATMNRHAEGDGIAYLGIEMRQDLIGDEEDIIIWAKRLVPVLNACLNIDTARI